MTTPKRPEDREAELPGKSDSSPSAEQAQMIGPYRIISVLGEGGMGSKEVLRRFEAERQALAMIIRAR